MLGIRQPLDGPVFNTYEDALGWCMDVMVCHHERGYGIADAQIQPFKGMVDSAEAPSPELLKDVGRICEDMRSELAVSASGDGCTGQGAI